MFFWNDPTLPFEMRKRTDFESVVSQDRFKIHNVDGMLMVEVNDHYALEDIKGLVQANHKPSDVIKLIEEGRICQFQDELTIPDEIDEDMAKKTPFGGTIAHGYLTLSLLPALQKDVSIKVEGAKMGVNYGFEKVRFLAPVPSGSKVRGRFTLKEAVEKKPGQHLLTYEVTVDIEGQEKPALIADWLGMQFTG